MTADCIERQDAVCPLWVSTVRRIMSQPGDMEAQWNQDELKRTWTCRSILGGSIGGNRKEVVRNCFSNWEIRNWAILTFSPPQLHSLFSTPSVTSRCQGRWNTVLAESMGSGARLPGLSHTSRGKSWSLSSSVSPSVKWGCCWWWYS